MKKVNNFVSTYAELRGVKIEDVYKQYRENPNDYITFCQHMSNSFPDDESACKALDIVDSLATEDFLSLAPEIAVVRYMTMMTDIEKQSLCALASQLLSRRGSNNANSRR